MKARLRDDLRRDEIYPPLLYDNRSVVGYWDRQYQRIDWNTAIFDCLQYQPKGEGEKYPEFNLVIHSEEYGLFYACSIDFDFGE